MKLLNKGFLLTALSAGAGFGLLPTQSLASVTYQTAPLTYTSASFTVSPLADGNNLWDTTITFKNAGTATIEQAYFVFLADEFYDPGPKAEEYSSWDNATQEWVYNSATLANAYAKPVNAAIDILMSPAETNIAYPGSLAGDDIAAYLMGSNIGPGQSVTFQVEEELTKNITASLGPSYAVVGTPEPATATLLGIPGLALFAVGAMRRRRTRKEISSTARD